jgi:tripartite-type tricarboxylate transporter receptor subunit TctC
VAGILLAGSAQAQTYPSKQITLVNPFSAGGSSDAYARLQAQYLEKMLGVPVIVEAVPGAGGLVAAQQVARSKPDGYTLLAGQSGFLTIEPNLVKEGAFNPLKELKMVATVRTQPLIVITRAGSPYKTIQDVLADAKKRPGEVTYSSIGVNSLLHLVGEMLAKTANVKLNHVPYSGSAQYTIDLLEGRLDLSVSTPSTLAQFPGQLRALAQASNERSVLVQDVPSAAEVGLPDWSVSSWASIMVTKNTPPEIIAKLDATLKQLNSDPTYLAKMKELGHEPFYHSAADWQPEWDRQVKVMGDLIAATPIKK